MLFKEFKFTLLSFITGIGQMLQSLLTGCTCLAADNLSRGFLHQLVLGETAGGVVSRTMKDLRPRANGHGMIVRLASRMTGLANSTRCKTTELVVVASKTVATSVGHFYILCRNLLFQKSF